MRMAATPLFALLLGMLLSGSASAVGPAKVGPPQTGPQPTESELIDRLVDDLDSLDEPRRVFAARELRRRVKIAVQQSSTTRGDPITAIEAQQELHIYDQLLAPRCIDGLGDESLARPCIDMLGLLETTEARVPLQAMLEDGAPWRTRRKLERALSRIGAEGEQP